MYRWICPKRPPLIVPTSIPTPKNIWPFAKMGSSGPVYPVALRASTSHASTAPV
jgi:hypothetical protein